jgi:hypothetical protein
MSSNLLPAAFADLMPEVLATGTVDRLLHQPPPSAQTSGTAFDPAKHQPVQG